jgi:RNA-directed DNA polymerase
VGCGEGYEHVCSFDNINHDILMEMLKKRIEDTQFLNLIRDMLEAGYVEDW